VSEKVGQASSLSGQARCLSCINRAPEQSGAFFFPNIGKIINRKRKERRGAELRTLMMGEQACSSAFRHWKNADLKFSTTFGNLRTTLPKYHFSRTPSMKRILAKSLRAK
jgi:hypothetical protein